MKLFHQLCLQDWTSFCVACWCRVPRQRIIFCLTCLFLVPWLYIEVTFPVRFMFKHTNVSSSCIIPRPNPFDPSILKFVWDTKPLVCDSSLSIVHRNFSGFIVFNRTALYLAHIMESIVECEYRTVRRLNDDFHITFGEPVSFIPPLRMLTDFYHVTCKRKDLPEEIVFDKMLTNIMADSMPQKLSLKDETRNQLNVILFGIDSVSRSAAIRKMPRTFKYLTDDLHCYDFKGYMKVGENTLPNLTPLLTGRRVWTDEVPITDYTTQPFDSFPFVWNNFSNNGYATMYAEDMPEIGTFTYFTKGFTKQPTHHYMRPFWLGTAEYEQLKNKLNPVFLYLEHKNLNLQKDSSLCYKGKPKHVIQIDYLKQFMAAYKEKRKFAFSFLVELSHEYPNFLSYGDEDFLNFLKWLKSEGHLDNTLLIFFSDHGARIDQIRNTFVGRIEDRMPLLEIVLPDHIKDEHPVLHRSVSINTNRLVTPFDVHQMLMDTLLQNFDRPTKSYINQNLRSISLFQEIPADRSCRSAWIPENYCACYTSSPLNISSSKIVHRTAAQMVTDLNHALSKEPKCAELNLYKIQDAQKISQGLEHVDTENTGISFLQFLKPENELGLRLLLTIETTPGHGHFEATYHISSKGDITVMGDIVRINKYGDQPYCISDKLLRPLCFCKLYKIYPEPT